MEVLPEQPDQHPGQHPDQQPDQQQTVLQNVTLNWIPYYVMHKLTTFIKENVDTTTIMSLDKDDVVDSAEYTCPPMPGSWPISPPASPDRSVSSSPDYALHKDNVRLVPDETAQMSGALLNMSLWEKTDTVVSISPPNGLIPAEYSMEISGMPSPPPEVRAPACV